MSKNFPDKSGLQAVVFDVDGTLVDAFGDIYNAAQAMMRHFGLIEKTPEQILEHVGYGLPYLVSHLLPWEANLSIEEGIRTFRNHYAEHCGEAASLYLGAIDFLEFLQRMDIPSSVLTNKPHDLTVKTLQKLGIESFFHTILGDGEGFRTKPDPEGFFHLCRCMNADPSEVIMVGDGDTDMQTAKIAGAQGWGIAAARFSEEQLRENGAMRTFPNLIRCYEAMRTVLD